MFPVEAETRSVFILVKNVWIAKEVKISGLYREHVSMENSVMEKEVASCFSNDGFLGNIIRPISLSTSKHPGHFSDAGNLVTGPVLFSHCTTCAMSSSLALAKLRPSLTDHIN